MCTVHSSLFSTLSIPISLSLSLSRYLTISFSHVLFMLSFWINEFLWFSFNAIEMGNISGGQRFRTSYCCSINITYERKCRGAQRENEEKKRTTGPSNILKHSTFECISWFVLKQLQQWKMLKILSCWAEACLQAMFLSFFRLSLYLFMCCKWNYDSSSANASHKTIWKHWINIIAFVLWWICQRPI